jgi:hypothetical protein
MRNAKQESKTIKFESDEQVIKRIETRFNILHDMTKAVIAGYDCNWTSGCGQKLWCRARA